MSEIVYYGKRLYRLGMLTWLGSMLSRAIYFILTSEELGLKGVVVGTVAGSIFDLYVALILTSPLFLAWIFLPTEIGQKKWNFRIVNIYLGFLYLFWLFTVVSEWTFDREFNSRFNFIAVDYLVYTHEVLQNIWQSYPVAWVLTGLLVLSVFLSAVSRRYFFFEPPSFQVKSSFSPIESGSPHRQSHQQSHRQPHHPPHQYQHRYTRFTFGLCGLALLAALTVFLKEEMILRDLGPNESEFAKNSIYTLFAAYRNNVIDFQKFYIHQPAVEAEKSLDQKTSGDFHHDSHHDSYHDSRRDSYIYSHNYSRIPARIDRALSKMNVVLVLMESMSPHYLDSYGSKSHLTPNLDRLISQGLWFSKMYATGTRTVRGIEAILLSVPPTPGQSIVRRPENDGLFHLGSVFQDLRYRTEFIYGGRAAFDNMGPFFANNGFDVIDQGDIESTPVAFKNAWGVSDEDIFHTALARANDHHARHDRFLQVILTTSNHRPYTFPEGRIQRPSGSGREAAVEYADWAIGNFLKKAEREPWFENTVFIFAADHQASVAGGTKIQPEDYLIPVVFYAPKILRSQEVKVLSSQIDIAATLFGLLKLTVARRQFGNDLLAKAEPRAFLATYQKVGYWEGDRIVILEPNRRLTEFQWRPGSVQEVDQWQQVSGGPLDATASANLASAHPLWMKTVGLYSLAYDWYKTGKLKRLSRP